MVVDGGIAIMTTRGMSTKPHGLDDCCYKDHPYRVVQAMPQHLASLAAPSARGETLNLGDLLDQHLSPGLIVERHSHPTRVHSPLLYPALRKAHGHF